MDIDHYIVARADAKLNDIKKLELEIALLQKHNKRQENRIAEIEAENNKLLEIVGRDVYLSKGFGDKHWRK